MRKCPECRYESPDLFDIVMPGGIFGSEIVPEIVLCPSCKSLIAHIDTYPERIIRSESYGRQNYQS